MAAPHPVAPAEWIRLSATYHIAPDATPESLFDDANELLDHARGIALALCHSLTEHSEVDINHISSSFAAIANMIDMAQSSSSHAHVQLLRERTADSGEC